MSHLNLGRELRSGRRLELRATDNGPTRFEGYATVWEHPYPVYGGPESGGWTETIARGAATKTLTDTPNRALLYCHDDDRVLLTTRAGLELSEDEIGLRVAGELDTRVSWIADLARQIETGVVDEMSMGFYALQSEWSPDYMTRRITEIKLVEVTIVWAGANDATVASIAARARQTIDEARRPAIDRRRAAALSLAAQLRS